ncbi:MAG: GGDEF domain-containing response regulator [Burkholderiales bacterium]|nr:GGDEF domain-containing response regulator [Burkholderiales bacterium]
MSNSPKILIVEDSEDDALLIQLQLKRVAPSAVFERVDDEASMTRALVGGEWDLVICDHNMPRFDSGRAMELLRRSGQDIPLVIFSGQMENELAINAMNSGAQDYVPKHEPSRLLPVVERELRNVGMRRAKRNAESSVIQLSRYDSLTRLPNLDHLREVMTRSLAEPGQRGLSPAVMCFDLDRFMRINESFGYAAGDALIRQIAARLQRAAGKGNLVARLGQDEFAIFTPDNADPFTARQYADRIAREFNQPFLLNGQEFFMTISCGIALYPEHGSDPATLLKNAESAMFSAKSRGGNRNLLYVREINFETGYQLKLENSLRQAVARNELFLMYQPILDVQSGRIVATEALVRWNHPDLGLIPPDEFIHIAEETGLIVDMGDWILLEACRMTRAWQLAGHPDLKVAVNFSANQFNLGDAAKNVSRILKESGLPASALELEITERIAMSDVDSAITTLRSLKETGAAIAIDDFGTGFSSLSYLKRFPIDVLKIDKSFVRDLPGDEEDAAITRTICVLGTSLHLTLHAEGVETAEQLDFLRGIGCQRAQGYHIARPLRANDVIAFLEDRDLHAKLGRVAANEPNVAPAVLVGNPQSLAASA